MITWILLTAAKLYCLLIAIQSLSSFFPAFAAHPMVRRSRDFTKPLLDAIRKILPTEQGGFDFSPIIGIIAVMSSAKFLAYLFL